MKHGDEMPVERIRMGLCEHCKALAAKDAELVRLRTEVAAWESSDIGDLRVELAAANEQIEKLRQRCEDFKSQFDSKVKVVEQLRAENEQLKARIAELLGKLQDEHIAVAALSERIERQESHEQPERQIGTPAPPCAGRGEHDEQH